MTFQDASLAEVDAVADRAAAAAPVLAETSRIHRASFLDDVARRLEGSADALFRIVATETGLGTQRLTTELARTVAQARMFATTIRSGDYVDARIDHGDPARTPAPRPDLRRMLVPIGPVTVFGASNFPLAYSVAGGDTVSALAAGCPVVVKAHPMHQETSDFVATLVAEAADASGMPSGTFALVHGDGPDVGGWLVDHPGMRGVGFTGSPAGGRALFDRAARRPIPIPVFAEMGSANPVVLLPNALAKSGAALAEALAQSARLACAQLCTSPGMLFVPVGDDGDRFVADFGARLVAGTGKRMVHPRLATTYTATVDEVVRRPGVRVLARGAAEDDATAVTAFVFGTDVATFCADARLRHEIYGPTVLVVRTRDAAELHRAIDALDGHLTATLHAAPNDDDVEAVFTALSRKAGRVLFGGVPTGVEVSPAMQHGGPYPASTDMRFTSVGTAAILRWLRPICYQDTPSSLLPIELRDENTCGLLRTIDGVVTRD